VDAAGEEGGEGDGIEIVSNNRRSRESRFAGSSASRNSERVDGSPEWSPSTVDSESVSCGDDDGGVRRETRGSPADTAAEEGAEVVREKMSALDGGGWGADAVDTVDEDCGFGVGGSGGGGVTSVMMSCGAAG
jgi:hypothetical protein